MTKIIDVQNLSKKYQIFHEELSSDGTLKRALARKFKNMMQCFRSRSQKVLFKEQETFWALKDINFSINEGDRLGIIGKNGSGKSTLLKILSRITEPTTGQIKMRGRVSSLLEVGAGFHPELTGRENIYLNGSILGMSKSEIAKKFEEIVDFAEIEKFLDTPVKRFSSGMYMRLGFAIAAHLDPDLLIVDEVLAVGDAQFQDKCLRKLNLLNSDGRTILFVSHDIGTLLALCNKGLLLENGVAKEVGTIQHCVNAYMRNSEIQGLSWKGNEGDEHFRLHEVVLNGKEEGKEFFYQGDKISLKLNYEVSKFVPGLVFGIGIWNRRNQRIARAHTLDNVDTEQLFLQNGHHQVIFSFDAGLFHEGDYLLKVESFIHNQKVIIDHQVTLKLPIFPHRKNTQFSQCSTIEGVSLGNSWHHL